MREIPLSRGLHALVSDEDYARLIALGPWCAVPQGDTYYAKAHGVTDEGRPTTIHMHSVVMNTRAIVDHRDRNGLNNTRGNLRVATQSLNLANSKLRKDNTSGYKGVTLDKRSGAWVARIVIEGKSHRLGAFPSAEQAARAYDTAALAAWGEYARPNFPEGLSA